ncbi:50S ribosomal protein P1 [Candidatus Woesearchaeota archaeon]|nr:MAG: 50S ribosomal protein P1 [Candidatus Woesearchaeota archaeon]
MEYIYAALLIHKAGNKITEDALKKVLEAAGVKADEAKIKSVVASLEGVNIEEALAKAATPVAAAAPAAAPAEEKKEEKKKPAKEEKKTEEEAAAGLSALFG